MGHTTARIKLSGPDLRKSREVELLVDTESTYTWIARTLLDELAVRPSTTRIIRTIDGRSLKRDVGEAIMEYAGERATRMVVFADFGDAEVLGVDALEGLGLEVDPVTRELRKAASLLAL